MHKKYLPLLGLAAVAYFLYRRKGKPLLTVSSATMAPAGYAIPDNFGITDPNAGWGG